MGRLDNATRSSWIAACRRGSGLRRTRSMARHPYYYIHTGNTGNTPYMPRIHAGGQPAEKHTSKWGTLGKTGQMGVFPAFCNTTKCTNDFWGDFFPGFLGSRRKLLYDSSSHREELLYDSSSQVRTAVCKELLSYSSSSRRKLLSYNGFNSIRTTLVCIQLIACSLWAPTTNPLPPPNRFPYP